MTLSFAKAPLVEIIAELRWIPPYLGVAPTQQSPQAPIPLIGDTKQEEFLMSAFGEFKNLGFNKPERLVSPGFVTLLYQPVFRFKKVPDPSPILYQVGAGIFSTHGLPPYKSWDFFAPEVERGIEALLKANDSKQQLNFSRVSLRYIDAFSKDLTDGRDEISFVKDILRINIELPGNLVNLMEPGAKPKMSVNFLLPVGQGLAMGLNLAEGNVNNASAIIMDTTVWQDTSVPADVAKVMDVLNRAHEIVHKSFLESTEPIHKLMQPQEV